MVTHVTDWHNPRTVEQDSRYKEVNGGVCYSFFDLNNIKLDNQSKYAYQRFLQGGGWKGGTCNKRASPVIYASNYGFNIPSSAKINYVEVEQRMQQSSGNQNLKTNFIRLKTTTSTTDFGSGKDISIHPYWKIAPHWSDKSTEVTEAKCGFKLTPQLINSPNFGQVIQAIGSKYQLVNPRISNLRIRVSYDVVGSKYDPKNHGTWDIYAKLQETGNQRLSMDLVEIDPKNPNRKPYATLEIYYVENKVNGVYPGATTPVVTITGKGAEYRIGSKQQQSLVLPTHVVGTQKTKQTLLKDTVDIYPKQATEDGYIRVTYMENNEEQYIDVKLPVDEPEESDGTTAINPKTLENGSQHCVLIGNTFDDCWAGYGGGYYLTDKSTYVDKSLFINPRMPEEWSYIHCPLGRRGFYKDDNGVSQHKCEDGTILRLLIPTIALNGLSSVANVPTTTEIKVLSTKQDIMSNVPVQISIPDLNIGNTVTTNSKGIAQFTYTPSKSGNYPITAHIIRSNTYKEGTTTTSITVARNTTRLVLTGDKTTTTIDSPITLTAVLTDKQANVVDGQVVIFSDENDEIGRATTTNGIAHLTYTPSQAGTKTFTAKTEQNDTYTNSTSNQITLQSTKITTSLAVTPTQATTPPGTSTEITVTLKDTANNPLPSQSVDIYNGTTKLSTVTTATDGTAKYNYTSSTVGTATISAKYETTTKYEGTTSNNTTITIAKINTAITLSASTTSPTVNTSTTLTAKLTTSTGTPISGQNITFYNGTTSIGTGTTNTSGQVAISYTPTSAGSYTISAKNTSTATYVQSTSNTVTLTAIYLTIEDMCTNTSQWVARSGSSNQPSISTVDGSTCVLAPAPSGGGGDIVWNHAIPTTGKYTLEAELYNNYYFGYLALGFSNKGDGVLSYSNEDNYHWQKNGQIVISKAPIPVNSWFTLKCSFDNGNLVSVKYNDTTYTPTASNYSISDCPYFFISSWGATLACRHIKLTQTG